MAKVRTPGFETLTKAIKRIGPYVCPEWNGTERTAPGRNELFHELAAIREMPRKRLLEEDAKHRRAIYEEAELKRAAGEPQSGTVQGIAKLRERIADPATPERQRAAMQTTLARLTAPPPAPDRNTRRIAERRIERTRYRLAEELFTAHEPAEDARSRWAMAHATLRDKVFAGEMRALARLPDGELLCPAAPEWRDCFPAPRTSRVFLPSLGGKIPATVLLAVAELDRIFPAGSSQQEQPGQPSEAAIAPAAMPKRGKPGPKTDATAKAGNDLLERLKAGTLSIEDLERQPASSIGKHYRLGETAATKSKNLALSQFRTILNSAE